MIVALCKEIKQNVPEPRGIEDTPRAGCMGNDNWRATDCFQKDSKGLVLIVQEHPWQISAARFWLIPPN